MQRAIVYKAADGKGFETVEECRGYERSIYIERLSNLCINDIENAIDGKNKELAIVIKKVANLIKIKLRPMAQALADPSGDKAGELLAEKLDKRRKAKGPA
jgi:hypothetical protein